MEWTPVPWTLPKNMHFGCILERVHWSPLGGTEKYCSKDWTDSENDMLLGLASEGMSTVSVTLRGSKFDDGRQSPSESWGVLSDCR